MKTAVSYPEYANANRCKDELPETPIEAPKIAEGKERQDVF
jgi:hypothetical protein